MDFAHRHTRHQVPRGTRLDATQQGKLILLKNVASLRATYQIRLAAFQASTQGLKLMIVVPKHCVAHPTLQRFLKEQGSLVRLERAS